MAGNRATAGHGSSEVRRSREARGTREDDGRPGPPRLATGPWRPSGPRTCRPSFQPPHNSPRRSRRGGTAPTRGAAPCRPCAGAAPRGSARSTRLRRSGEVERDQGREAKGVRDRASAPSPPATGSRDEETETSRRRRGPRKKKKIKGRRRRDACATRRAPCCWPRPARATTRPTTTFAEEEDARREYRHEEVRDDRQGRHGLEQVLELLGPRGALRPDGAAEDLRRLVGPRGRRADDEDSTDAAASRPGPRTGPGGRRRAAARRPGAGRTCARRAVTRRRIARLASRRRPRPEPRPDRRLVPDARLGRAPTRNECVAG